jgi:hypothetical protein
MPNWSSRAPDPRADKAGDTLRRWRSTMIGKRIVKHRKGELDRFLPPASGKDWTQRIDSDFYRKLYNSDPQIRQEIYWLWEELEVITDSLLTTFSDAQDELKKQIDVPRSPDRVIGKGAY